MKYLSFVVPCYNSEEYMERCVDTLLTGGEDVEILIIDDGSTDATGELADRYEALYPGTVRAVHQSNGGHGAGVNRGLALASGLYFKVVDSDDWVDRKALRELLHAIRFFAETGAGEGRESLPDLFLCNYVYEREEEGRRRTVNYRNLFPAGRVCTWEEMGRFRLSQYLVMHALVFRTGLLRECGLRLPEHCFYVDNLFANAPLPAVRRLCYLDVDLYHYCLGREDQSVNERVLMSRIDQQLRVTRLVSRCADLHRVREVSPKLAAYLRRNISVMVAISSVHLLLIGTPEAREKRRRLWQELRRFDCGLYRRLRFTTLSGLTYLPGRVGGWLTIAGYRAARRCCLFQ